MKWNIGVWLSAVVILLAGGEAKAEHLTGTLQKIQNSETITIGYREASPPFSFIGSDGKPQGYSIDLCLGVVDAVRLALKQPNLAIKWFPVTSNDRIDRLVAGDIDIECGSTSHTLDRREKVDFSYFTFLTGTRVMVKKGAGIADYKDLSGRKVAVTKGTTNETRLQEMIKLLGVAMDIVLVDDHDRGFAAVTDGMADAFALDDILLRGLLKRKDPKGEYTIVGQFLSYDPYALMVRRDDANFRLMVDRALSGLFFRRDLGAIFAKWFDPFDVKLDGALLAAMSVQMHRN